ncbi:hypothetical protein NP493_16g12067 [Ridgeia piscesae]|uniref:Uncharacterized protein n=1 Tax=Ridgeia piscesae TaxID=27915 RepID=A0AAD9PEJ9_RIDPI|nr:hypothetical protein NP493_16g12067 [Ridgeia piscesae]
MKAAMSLVGFLVMWMLSEAQVCNTPHPTYRQDCEVKCRYGYCCCKVLQEEPGVPDWPEIPPKTKFLGPTCCTCCCDKQGFAHCNDGYEAIILKYKYYC